jgi:hypothetical protein
MYMNSYIYINTYVSHTCLLAHISCWGYSMATLVTRLVSDIYDDMNGFCTYRCGRSCVYIYICICIYKEFSTATLVTRLASNIHVLMSFWLVRMDIDFCNPHVVIS